MGKELLNIADGKLYVDVGSLEKGYHFYKSDGGFSNIKIYAQINGDYILVAEHVTTGVCYDECRRVLEIESVGSYIFDAQIPIK